MQTTTNAPAIDLKKITVYSGGHKAPPGGIDENAEACAMEWVSVLAGEPFSASPKCACPAITSFVIRFNDRITDTARRTELIQPLLESRILIGTRGPKKDYVQRGYMAADWAARHVTPTTLRLLGFDELADRCEKLDPLVDPVSAKGAAAVLREVRKELWGKYYADAAAAADAAADVAAAAADAADAAAAALSSPEAFARWRWGCTCAEHVKQASAVLALVKKKGPEFAEEAKRFRAELEDSAIDLIKRMCAVGREAQGAEAT